MPMSPSGGSLVLHADNGSPMKGATMLATLQKLGVVPSFSRPSVSDDNLCAATAATWTHRWQPTSVWERKLKGARAP